MAAAKGPMTTDEFLDHVVSKFNPVDQYGERVEAFLLLAGGAARSSKSVTCIQLAEGRKKERFDMHHDISGTWQEVSRKKFKELYPQEGKIWNLYE